MAHKYDNFDDAFDVFSSKWAGFRDWLSWAGDGSNYAIAAAESGDWEMGIKYAVNVGMGIFYGLQAFLDTYNDDYKQSHFMESIYWAQKDAPEPEPYELTAKAICEAWGKDDFADRAITITFIDRMRQLIWNEPYYVAWAARPEDKG